MEAHDGLRGKADEQVSKAIRIAHVPGETVFLRTDQEQLPRIVIRINVAQGGAEYQLRHSDREGTWHQACEIMREPKGQRKAGYKP